MDLGLILDMAASGYDDRVAVVADGEHLTYADIQRMASAIGAWIRERRLESVVYIATSHVAYPVALFGATLGGVPFVPLNYRLSDAQLGELLAHHPRALVVHGGAGDPSAAVVDGVTVTRQELLSEARTRPAGEPVPADPDAVAVVLYTSGTSSAPKAALLRHRHLSAYLFGSVEFGGAGADEATLVSVPPYHVAGLANLLSNLYAGRRVVYLPTFRPEDWVALARTEHVTQAMVVPTMLARIVDYLDAHPDVPAPPLRTLSYGGARTPAAVIEGALRLFPDTGFVNAYGLTETSSTIALLGPEDHRQAFDSAAGAARGRLASVGRLLPGIEVEVRDDSGAVLAAGTTGLVFLRGEQISGEYRDGSLLDGAGWFATRDRGWVDPDGYLFVEGRADDTIIRGGENIAPEEIEDVILAHPDISEAAVVGLPDEVWGQRLVAVVVGRGDRAVDVEVLRRFCVERLRSSKTPETFEIWTELPRTDTGKLIRRHLVAALQGASGTPH